MAFTVTRFSELPLRNSLPITSQSPSLNLLFSSSKPSFLILKTFCSVRTKEQSSGNRNPRSNRSSNRHWSGQSPKPSRGARGSPAPWLNKWPPAESQDQRAVAEPSGRDRTDRADTVGYVAKDRGKNAIERIVLRLRNLGNAF